MKWTGKAVFGFCTDEGERTTLSDLFDRANALGFVYIKPVLKELIYLVGILKVGDLLRH
jgi:hypothetical protein